MACGGVYCRIRRYDHCKFKVDKRGEDYYMHVLQVMSCIEYGGTEAFVYNHCKQILREHPSDEIALLICGNHINENRKNDFVKLGIRIYNSVVPSIKNYRVILNTLQEIKNTWGVDVIHSHMNLGNVVIMHAAVKLNIAKRISHSHDTAGYSGNPVRHFEQLMRRNCMIKDATDLLACSEKAGDYLYGKMFSECGKVIPNGINEVIYEADDTADIKMLRQEFDLENKFVLGNITRFDTKKNQIFLVEILENLVDQIPDIVLVLGGVDGGEEQRLRQIVKEKHLLAHVRFVGVRQDIVQWMKLLDIWVMPSLFEGLPITLLEAQFSGLYCLVSDTVSGEADTGYGLIEYLRLQEDEWKKAIIRYYKNPVHCDTARLIEWNHQSKFEIHNSAEMLYAVYKNDRSGK